MKRLSIWLVAAISSFYPFTFLFRIASCVKRIAFLVSPAITMAGFCFFVLAGIAEQVSLLLRIVLRCTFGKAGMVSPFSSASQPFLL